MGDRIDLLAILDMGVKVKVTLKQATKGPEG
jgi:hypothetical protein